MIVVIGDIIQDIYIYCESNRIAQEAPVPVATVTRSNTMDGGAANVYNNVKSLTDQVMLNTVSIKPVTKTRYIINGQQTLRIDDDNGVFHTHMHMIDSSDIIVISDYNKGAVAPSMLPLQQCIVDTKRDIRSYSGAFIVKPNRKEFQDSFGEWDTMDELKSLMLSAKSSCRFQNIIVTLDSDGCVLLTSDNNFFIYEASIDSVVDTTGAGDTFLAVLATFIHNGHSIQNATEYANIAAGIATTHRGPYTVTKSDVMNQMVFTNGCFDILHPGHIELLKNCRRFGNYVVVGLNSDSSVKRLKGINRPILPDVIRKQMISSLGLVDEVIIFDEDTPYELIKRLSPDVIVKGGDYKPCDVIGSDLCRVEIVPYIDGFSTTNIIERIKNAT